MQYPVKSLSLILAIPAILSLGGRLPLLRAASERDEPLTAPLARTDPRAQVDPALREARGIAPLRFRPGHASASRWLESIVHDCRAGRDRTVAMPVDRLRGELRAEGRRGTATAPAGNAYTIEKVWGTDDRVRVGDTTLYPYSAACKLYMTFPKGNFVGSGVLISPRHVLTVGHCVYDKTQGGWATRIVTVPGMDESYMPFGWSDMIRAQALSDWVRRGNVDADLAVITLEDDLGTSAGVMGYASTPSASGVRGTITGYPTDRNSGEAEFTSSGKITGETSLHVTYKIDTYFGSSGSPIYRTDKPTPTVFGVNSWFSSRSNGGPKIDRTRFKWIRSIVNAGS